MKKVTIKDWIAALRSGKFKQATRGLYARKGGEDAFCCLGVYECLLRGVEETLDKFRENINFYYDDLPKILGEELFQEAIARNDGNQFEDVKFKSHTFEEIATWLEQKHA